MKADRRNLSQLSLALAAILGLASARSLSASPFEISYSARLVDEKAKPLTGSLNLTIKFFDGVSGGSQKGGALNFTDVKPNIAGIFTIGLSLPNSDFSAVLGGDTDTWVEITNNATGKVYPRQRLAAAPYALRVPTDSTTLRYSNGRLAVNRIDLSQVEGLTAVLNQYASKVHTHSLLGDVTGSLGTTTVVKLLGREISTQAPVAGQFLKWNGTAWIPAGLSGDLNLGSAATLGLGFYSSVQEGQMSLQQADKGKMWFNSDTNQVRYWDGASVKVVGAVGAGLNSLNGLSSNTQSFAIGSSGSEPAWVSSLDKHTLNLPNAATADVNAGLISHADYLAFSNKANLSGANFSGAVQMIQQNELRFGESMPAGGSEYVGFRAPAILSANQIWTLPASDGQPGQVLKTDGQGSLAWVSGNAGSVTSVGLTAPSAGITVSGGPITSAGSLSLGLSDDLAGLENLNSTGIAVRSGADAWTTITNKSAEWNTAYSERMNWDGNSTGLNASAARTSLGLGILAEKNSITGAEISDGSVDFSDIKVTPCAVGTFLKTNGSWTCAPIVSTDINANVSATEFGYLDGLSSSIQTQLNAKQATIGSSSTLDAGGFSSVLQSAFDIKPYGTSSGQTGELRFTDLPADGGFYVGFKAPSTVTANKIWTLPAADGLGGQVLKTDGAGNLGWVSAATGSVTSITAGTGLSGGTITGAGTIDLSNTGVTAAAYTRANITVDAQGRLTAASNGVAISSADISNNTIINEDIAVGAAIDQSKIANLSTDLSAKQPLIAPGTTAEYWRGDKSWQTLNTSVVTEGANLYYSDTRARGALSAVSPVSYSSGTGVFSLAAASSAADGYLSSSDWTRFNNKIDADNPTFTGSMSNALGTEGAPSYSFTGDNDSGLWSPGANTVSIATMGLNRLTVAEDGKVGIGPSSPSALLDLSTTASDSQFAVFRGLQPNLPVNGINYIKLGQSASNRNEGSLYFRYVGPGSSNNTMSIGFYGTGDHLAVLAGGNVGVATTSPGSKLQVNGNVAIGYNSTSAAPAGGLAVFGNVGIGTTTPTQKLTVVGTIESTSGGIKFPDGSVQVTAIPLRNGVSSTTPGRSCLQILSDGYSTGNGKYWLAPIGLSAFQVHCDMTTDGGGWTLMARNNAATTFTNFNKSWASYKTGFGDVTVNTSWGWLGNDRIHAMTRGGVELLVANNVQQHYYKSFLVDSEANKYGMSVLSTASSRDGGTFASYQGMMPFSTYDQDNDPSATNCASSYSAGWWYNDCYYASIASSSTGQVYWHNAASHEPVTWIEMWIR